MKGKTGLLDLEPQFGGIFSLTLSWIPRLDIINIDYVFVIPFASEWIDHAMSVFRNRTGARFSILFDTGATVTVLKENLSHLLSDTCTPTRALATYTGEQETPIVEGRLGPYISRAVVSTSASYNILSASQIMGPGAPFIGHIDGNTITCLERKTKKILIEFIYIDGLWFGDLEDLYHGLYFDTPENDNYAFWPNGLGDRISAFSCDCDCIAYAHALPINRALLYHISKGHPNMKKLWNEYKKGIVVIDGPPITREEFYAAGEFCRICALGKSTQSIIKKSKRVTTYPFELLSIDICEPGTVSHNGYTKFAVIVDHYTRMVWVLLLKKKSDIYGKMELWLQQKFGRHESKLSEVELPIVRHVRKNGIDVVRTDGAAELNSDEFIKLISQFKLGEKQTSIPYSHTHNALAEAAIREICKIARLICIQYNEPKYPELWEFAVMEAARLKNRLGNVNLPGGITPYERLYGEPPNSTAERPHGALCYAVRPIGEGSLTAKDPDIPPLLRSQKFDQRAFTCKYLARPPGSKGYTCLLIDPQYRDRIRIGNFRLPYFDCRKVGYDRIPCSIAGSIRAQMKSATHNFLENNPDIVEKDLDNKHLFQIFIDFLTKEGEELVSFGEKPPMPKLGSCKFMDSDHVCDAETGCPCCRRGQVLYRKAYNMRPILGCSKCRYATNGCAACRKLISKFNAANPEYAEPDDIDKKSFPETALDYLAIKDIENENEVTLSGDINPKQYDVIQALQQKILSFPNLDIIQQSTLSIPRIQMPGSESTRQIPLMIPIDLCEAVLESMNTEYKRRKLIDQCGGLVERRNADHSPTSDEEDTLDPELEDICFRHLEAEKYRKVLRSDYDFKSRFDRFHGTVNDPKVRRRFVKRAAEGARAKSPDSVIMFRDDERNLYYVETPSDEFVSMYGIAEGKVPGADGKIDGANATFSHIEMINTLSHKTGERVPYSAQFVPVNGKQALKSKEWREKAMFPELKSLVDMGCFGIVPRSSMPEGQKTISGKWVFVRKHDTDGNLTRLKGRYVARGFSQREGIDYAANHTYAPVAAPETVRAQLCFAAHRRQHAHQLDIGNAFIINDLQEKIYMPIPYGLKEYYESAGLEFPSGEEMVVQLKKTLYGLVQSSFCFYHTLVESLKSLGFVESSEPCFFTRKETDGTISTVTIYVDDLVITFSDEKVMQKFKIDLENSHDMFVVEDRGVVNHLLGVKVEYDRENGKFCISQEAYIEKLFERFDLHEIDRQLVPMKKEDAMMFAKPAKWELGQLKQGKKINNERCDATRRSWDRHCTR